MGNACAGSGAPTRVSSGGGFHRRRPRSLRERRAAHARMAGPTRTRRGLRAGRAGCSAVVVGGRRWQPVASAAREVEWPASPQVRAQARRLSPPPRGWAPLRPIALRRATARAVTAAAALAAAAAAAIAAAAAAAPRKPPRPRPPLAGVAFAAAARPDTRSHMRAWRGPRRSSSWGVAAAAPAAAVPAAAALAGPCWQRLRGRRGRGCGGHRRGPGGSPPRGATRLTPSVGSIKSLQEGGSLAPVRVSLP